MPIHATRLGAVVLLAAMLHACLVSGAGTASGVSRSNQPNPSPADYAVVWSQPGVLGPLRDIVASEIARLRTLMGRDFGVHPGRLHVRLYATHASFAHALRLQQHRQPQAPLDDTSSVVHGTLLLGPLSASYLQHNLAHVYAEWLIDGLIGNRSGALPSNPWLYDGLAEYEAYRHAPGGMRCSGGTESPFDVTTVRTARRWMALRPGPLGPLEYCLAYLQVRRIIARVRFPCVVSALRHIPWPRLAGFLMSPPARRRSCV